MDYKKILFFIMVATLFAYTIYMIPDPTPTKEFPYLTDLFYNVKTNIISSFSLA